MKGDLRYLHDNNGIRDPVYPYLHGEKVYVYVEYYGNNKNESTHVGKVRDGIEQILRLGWIYFRKRRIREGGKAYNLCVRKSLANGEMS